MRAHHRGLLLGVFGVAVISPDSLLVRLMSGDINAILTLRGVGVALAMAVFLCCFPALRRGFRWWPVLLYGFFFSAGSATFALSVMHTYVANTLVIITLAPIIAAIVAHFVLHEATSRFTWVCALSVFLGVLVIFSGSLERGGWLGDLMALVTAITLACNSVIVRRYPDVAMFPGIFFGGLMAVVCFVGFADWQDIDALDVSLAMVNGGVVIAISIMLIAAASKYLPPAEVNLLFLLEMVLAPLWVWLLLDEVPPLSTFAIGALILPVLLVHGWWSLRQAA